MVDPARPDEVDRGPVELRPFDQSLPMALLRAREATMRFFRPALHSRDLTEQQWRVLRALAAAPRPLEVGEIADRTFLLGPSLTRILNNLEGRDLVRRSSVPHDQRRAQLALTDAGLGLFGEIAPISESKYDEIQRLFGTDQLRDLLVLLDALAHIDDTASTQATGESPPTQ